MSASDGNTAAQWVPTGSVTVRVPGKVNLYLAVGDRREDGYHELTTVFHAVSLLDEVTVRNADVLSLELVGEGAHTLPTDERNLAWQAAELLADERRDGQTHAHHGHPGDAVDVEGQHGGGLRERAQSTHDGDEERERRTFHEHLQAARRAKVPEPAGQGRVPAPA